VAVVVDELDVVPAQEPRPSEPVASAAPDLPAPSVAEQVQSLLVVLAARAERLRAD
jgi:hypothetical protein